MPILFDLPHSPRFEYKTFAKQIDKKESLPHLSIENAEELAKKYIVCIPNILGSCTTKSGKKL